MSKVCCIAIATLVAVHFMLGCCCAHHARLCCLAVSDRPCSDCSENCTGQPLDGQRESKTGPRSTGRAGRNAPQASQAFAVSLHGDFSTLGKSASVWESCLTTRLLPVRLHLVNQVLLI